MAAQAHGVSPATFYRWRQKGKNGDPRYAEVESRIARAVALAERGLIQKAADGDNAGVGFGPGKAALEILQRRFSRRWSAKVTHEIADMTQRVLDVVRRVCSETDYARVLEELAREDSEGAAPGDTSEPASPVH